MKLKNILLSLLCFAAYVLLVWQKYDMYIGTVLTTIINCIHVCSGALFATILYVWRSKKLLQEDVGMYCGLLFPIALANGIFTAMAWGAWIGLPLSALLMILIFANKRKFPE